MVSTPRGSYIISVLGEDCGTIKWNSNRLAWYDAKSDTAPRVVFNRSAGIQKVRISIARALGVPITQLNIKYIRG